MESEINPESRPHGSSASASRKSELSQTEREELTELRAIRRNQELDIIANGIPALIGLGIIFYFGYHIYSAFSTP